MLTAILVLAGLCAAVGIPAWLKLREHRGFEKEENWWRPALIVTVVAAITALAAAIVPALLYPG